MPRVVIRVLMAAGGGATLGALLLLLVYPTGSTLAIEMDRDPPAFLTGTYAVEREGDRTFAWTSSRVVLRLAGLDRRVAWTCTLHVRGARDASLPMPTLTLAFDGAGSVTTPLDNDFRDVTLEVPARPGRAGLTLTADVAPTFRPGASDPRDLGAQVDWVRCVAAGWAWPPAGALRAAAGGGAALATASVIAGASLALTIPVVLVASAGQALLLATGGGVFGPYPALLTVIVLAASVAIVLLAWAPVLIRRPPLGGAALAAVAVSVVLAALKLAALEHPAKPLIDAVFQAHRLEWVMAGRYFFTQPMPSGVQFPYAIGLFVTAAPLASVVTDHILLLRLVVVTTEAIGGLLLYAVIVRGFGDRVAGVLAVALFHLAPVSHVVMGNANLTNTFAQAVGLCALCGLALMPPPSWAPRAVAAGAAVALLTALAFLSHVGTIVVVACILGTVVATWLLARRRELTTLAVFTIVMTLIAGLVSAGLYYRHFMDVYRDALERVRAPAVTTEARPIDARPDAPAILVRPLAWHERASNSAMQTVDDIGWPVLLLAAVGATMHLRRRRDRVPLLVAAWALAWLLLLVGGTLTRVDVQFQRYAAEFVARVNLAAYPMLAALAALGASVMWRGHRPSRVVAVVLVGVALLAGAHSLSQWLA